MEFRNTLNFVLSIVIIYLIVNSIPAIYFVFVAFTVTVFGIKLAEQLMRWTRKHVLYKRICPKNKAILITGCDSGFGNALARRLDKLGYTVFATCLDSNGEGTKKLTNDCSEKMKVFTMNVTDDRSIQQAKDFVEKNLGQDVLWAVVNNAGILHAGQIDWTSVEEIQKVYDVNAVGTLRVTKCFLPFLKKSKGRIVNVTSHAGHYSNPGFVGYCMSKSAGIALTTGLRIELTKWGVKAISIEPFFFATKITDLQAMHALAEKTWKSAPKEIKEEYGEKHFEYFKTAMNTIKYMCTSNITEVVDCLEDAITAKEPLSTYSAGCDSGFGNALARRMEKLGYFVYATCLNPDGEGAKKLSEECSKNLTVLSMDVTDGRSIEKVKEHVGKNLEQNVLWAVINNAGVVHYGQIDWTSFEELQQVYNVNTAGTLRVTKTFLPYLKKSKGRIINLTSLAAHYTTPGMVGYSMSKSATNVLTSGLRVELAKWGIKSISIEPHIYSTPISEKGTVFRLAENSWTSAPKGVVDEYGEDYLDHFKKSINFCLSLFLNQNIFNVIDDMEDAITAEEPLSTYIPGNIAHKFIVSLVQILPSGLNDSLQKKFFSAKPASLKLKEEKNR